MSINILDLIDDEILKLVSGSVTLTQDDCGSNPKVFDFSNYSPSELFSKTLHIPLSMTQDTENVGFYGHYGCTGDTWDYGYTVSGECDSRLEEVQNYRGEYTVGVNFSKYPSFTGVLSMDDDIVTYVIGGVFDTIYVSGTGVTYTTNILTLKTTFEYQLTYWREDYCWGLKDTTKMGLVSEDITNNVFIERNAIISVNELHYKMMEMKTSSDFDDSSYKTIKSY